MRLRHLHPLELLVHGCIIAVPLVLAFVLVLHRMAPSGVYSVVAGTLERSPYINRILPIARAPEDDGVVRLVEDPAYFTVDVPSGGYGEVDVTLEFEKSEQPLFELGALTDMYANSYDLHAMYASMLDDSGWTMLRDPSTSLGTGKERVLLDRNGTFASIASFMADLPDRTSIATYHDELDVPYRSASYHPLGSTQSIDVSLRGYHTFATYIRDETLDVTIAYMDMNRTEGADAGAVRVWNEHHEVVAESRIVDDGITSDSQENSGVPTSVRVTAYGLDEGVYTVELSGTSDIFWRRITTPQRYVTFVNQVYIADEVGYQSGTRATAFVTTAKHLMIETFHADSPQAIVVGSTTIPLPQSHEKVRQDIPDSGLVAGSTPTGDVRITGAGLFAFSRESFFNPYPVRLTAYTDLDAEGIDYVLATYTPLEEAREGVYRATARFDLDAIRQSDDTLKFILSAPGIADTDGIRIHTIRVDFKKPPKSFSQVIATLLQRIL